MPGYWLMKIAAILWASGDGNLPLCLTREARQHECWIVQSSSDLAMELLHSAGQLMPLLGRVFRAASALKLVQRYLFSS